MNFHMYSIFILIRIRNAIGALINIPFQMEVAPPHKLLTLLNTVNTVFIGYNITVYADYAT